MAQLVAASRPMPPAPPAVDLRKLDEWWVKLRFGYTGIIVQVQKGAHWYVKPCDLLGWWVSCSLFPCLVFSGAVQSPRSVVSRVSLSFSFITVSELHQELFPNS